MAPDYGNEVAKIMIACVIGLVALVAFFTLGVGFLIGWMAT